MELPTLIKLDKATVVKPDITLSLMDNKMTEICATMLDIQVWARALEARISRIERNTCKCLSENMRQAFQHVPIDTGE